MGFLRELITGRPSGVASGVAAGTALHLPVVSPYTERVELPPFLVTDLLGEDALRDLPMTRGEAVRIPAVSKGRNLIVSTVAKLPLRVLDADGVDVTDQYPWLHTVSGVVAPYERMAWTVDDLIFHGMSLWLLRREPATEVGPGAIVDAEWCPTSSWTIRADEDGVPAVHVDGVAIADENYMLINSPFEGLLTVGARTLRGARDIEISWVGRAKNPAPLIVLKRTGDDELTNDEVQALVDRWAKARLNPNGAIGSLPNGIELEVPDVKLDAALMIAGRNAVRTDVGSFLNVRASMLDGTSGIDSLTYTTVAGERNAFIETDLPFWSDPIAARMSLDDIVAPGHRVRFDLSEAYTQTPAPTGATVGD